MINLYQPRVVILEDNLDDAGKVLRALASNGIPAIHYTGDIEQLPEHGQALVGVRLLILDLHLVLGDAWLDTLESILTRILSIENGPYVIVAWTRDPDHVDFVKTRLHESDAIPHPVIFRNLNKEDYLLDGKGHFNLTKFSTDFLAVLQLSHCMSVLQFWEARAENAATSVINSLNNVALIDMPVFASLEEFQKYWSLQMGILLRGMSEAYLGKTFGDETFLKGVYPFMNPLHADEMEHGTAEAPDGVVVASKEIFKITGNASSNQKAKLNTRIHISTENLSMFNPGNLYQYKYPETPDWIMAKDRLIQDLLQTAITLEQMAPLIRIITLEIGALCDHSQNKISIAKFLMGLAVPESQMSKIKPGDFMVKKGPFYLTAPFDPGVYYFCFNSRALALCDLESVGKQLAALRIRTELLVSLQNWYAGQSTRPGIVQF